MPGVFISYRREDSSGYAGRLFDILSGHFGRQNTFMDLDTIQGGDDFAVVIEQKISTSDVLVAVIGVHWLTIADEQGKRRLDNPRDFVRLEIASALKRGIRVIPVLVGGAVMPRAEDLPPDLSPLSERQAIEVRDTHFHSDAEQLIGILHEALHGGRFRFSNLNGKYLVAALAVGIIIAIVVGVLVHQHASPGAAHSSTPVTAVPGTKAVGISDDRPVTHEQRDDRVPTGNKSKSTAEIADVSGRWTAPVKYDWGDSYTETFEFEIDSNELSGTASFLGVDRGIVDGRIDGSRVSFTTKTLSTISSDDKTYEDKHLYKGIVDGNQIRFTMMTDSSMESHVPIHFTASKIKAR